MRPVLSVLVTALLASPAGASPPPTPAALRRALVAAASALVEVSGPEGRGSGIVVGTGGEVLTSVHFVSLERAQLRAEKERAPGQVIAASATLGTALVRPERALATHPVAVRAAAALRMGGWLIAVTRVDPRHPLGVRILSVQPDGPFLQLAAPLAPGTALLDDQGALVALVVRREHALSTAVRLAAVKAQLGQKEAR